MLMFGVALLANPKVQKLVSKFKQKNMTCKNVSADRKTLAKNYLIGKKDCQYYASSFEITYFSSACIKV